MAKVNPYRDWLNLRSARPSTLYELLDVPVFTRDVSTIRGSGRQLKRKARRYQIGQYRETALNLLTQISRAVATLTNPLKRRIYNRRMLGLWLRITDRIFDEQAGGVCDARTAVEWLLGSANWSVPVARLLPLLIRRLLRGTGKRGALGTWPAHCEGGTSFPVAVWLYRDVVVLGQLLGHINLARRVDAVQGLQRTLKIPEALARRIVTEVSETRGGYDRARLVEQARSAPRQVMARLLKRLKRNGSRLKSQSATAGAVGKLLGLAPSAIEEISQRVRKQRSKTAGRK